MDFFFNPQAVAVVGATPSQSKGGYAILRNLMVGFQGPIYPVNPRYQEIEGLPCYPTVSAITGKVDLAIIFVPAPFVPAVLDDCDKKAVPGVIIESSGFAETGTDGKALQQQIGRTAARTGMRIWGPNCMGLVDAVAGRVFSFLSPQALEAGLIPGKVSLIVQSGMLSAGFLLDIMSHGIMGISKACSIGNKVDVNENDLLKYLLNDSHTEVIGLYLESFVNGREFIELCRQSKKPIVVLKGGKSRNGAEAALSHTASLAGNYEVIKGALAQTGVVEAKEFKQMMDLCRSLACCSGTRTKNGGGTAILTFSGGAGILSSDFLDENKVTLARLSASTEAALGKIFPPWMPVANPVDLWPAVEKHGADSDVYSIALQAVLNDENVEAVLLHAVAGAFRVKINLAEVARQSALADKPVFIWIMGYREEVFRFQKEAGRQGLAVFQDLYRAAECLAVTLKYRDNLPGSFAVYEPNVCIPAELEEILHHHMGVLDEFTSKKILQAASLPTVHELLLSSGHYREEIGRQLDFPLVMKGMMPGQIHKTESGLVLMNIDSQDKAAQAAESLMEIMRNQGRVLVQKQIPGKLELILGLLRDPQFGVCVMLGLGGILAEAFADAAFAVAPLSRDDALALIGRLKTQKLLNGFRGSPPVNREELAQILIHLGALGLAYPRIKEVDINPLIIDTDGRPVAVDATLVLSD